MIEFTLRYRESSHLWISQLANMQRRWWDHYNVDDKMSLEIGKYCFHAVDRPEMLQINGKDVNMLMEELDNKFLEDDLAKKKPLRYGQTEEKIEYKLPTYDFRATDYCYGSKSVLGDMYKEYTKHLTTWATLNEDRKLVSNGGNGGLLDEDLMKYKQLYFNKLQKESAKICRDGIA